MDLGYTPTLGYTLGSTLDEKRGANIFQLAPLHRCPSPHKEPATFKLYHPSRWNVNGHGVHDPSVQVLELSALIVKTTIFPTRY